MEYLPPVATDIPIFINTRDRVGPLRKLVAWLEHAGATRIVIVDNASTYPPLLKYLDASPHEVVRLAENVGQMAPWHAGVIGERISAGQRYVVTDPDILPDRACPIDVLDHFSDLLDRYPETVKVGFGLRIDDLPRRYRHAEAVRRWESRFWTDEAEPGVYRAPIDTTFALYREDTPFTMEPALRTGAPYLAQHLPWYLNSWRPSREQRYYLAHARSDINSWDRSTISDHIATTAGVDPSGRATLRTRISRRLRP